MVRPPQRVFSSASPYAAKMARLSAFAADAWFGTLAQLLGLSLGGAVASWMTHPSVPRKAAMDALTSGSIIGWAFWGAVGFFLNYGVLQGMTGASIGKMLLGLRVVGHDGAPIGVARSLARSFCYIFSYLPLMLGYAAILWSRESQCWHDLIAGTVVIEKGAVYPPREEAAPRATETVFPKAA